MSVIKQAAQFGIFYQSIVLSFRVQKVVYSCWKYIQSFPKNSEIKCVKKYSSVL